MALLARLFERRSTNPPTDAAMVRMLTVGAGSAPITPGNAMALATVLACVRVLAESIAMLPLELRLRQQRGSIAATMHPVYSLLRDLPNPETTSAELRLALAGHLALYGNAYCQLVADRAGRWIEMWPLRPDKTEPVRLDSGQLAYKHTRPDGEIWWLPAAEVLHIRGLSNDGLIGYSPITMARRVFETKTRMEEYENSFYANGARPGVVLQHPHTLSPVAQAKLIESWQSRHGGAGNANKIAILEEGMTIEDLGVPQTDAQFIESQKLTKAEIASLFRVPLHMVNDLDRATFANIEQMSLEFVIYSLTPWLVCIEQAISRSLLTPSERSRYYAKHKLQALLRGDNASRSQFYSTGLQWGYLSVNDVRELEDLQPIDAGDTYFVPLNMIPIEQAAAGAGAATPASEPGAATRSSTLPAAAGCTCGGQHGQPEHRASATDDASEDLRLARVATAAATRPVFEDVASRMVKRESADIQRAIAKVWRQRGADEFSQWLATYYQDFASVLRDAFQPAVMSTTRHASMAAAAELQRKPRGLTDQLRSFAAGYLDSLADGWCASARTQIEIVISEAIAAGADPVAAVEDRLNRWQETKVAKVADRQSFEALNAALIASYGVYGATRYQWLARGDSCPYCRQLSGRSAGIEEYIVGAGSQLDGGESGNMEIRRNVRHGPIHGGCDCTVAAVR
jgi:HK97 family phage portal protein